MSENTYTVQLLSSIQEINETRDEWLLFLKEKAEKCVFWQDPNLIPGILEYSEYDTPLILLIRRNGLIECVAPGVIDKERFLFSFSVFHFSGPFIRNLKILGEGLVFAQNADKEQCLHLVFKELKKRQTRFDIIKLDNLELSSPLALFFTSSHNRHKPFQLKKCCSKEEFTWKHILASDYGEWLATLGKSTRRLVKRRVKKLYKVHPDQIEFRKITQKNEVIPYLDLLDEVYPKTWQAKTFGLKKRNTQRDINFYKMLAEHNWLRSYMLLINDSPVAFFVGCQYNKAFEALEIGYDAEFSSLGVGSALSYMVIEDLYDSNKPAYLDFGFGENKYKSLICNHKSPASEAYITRTNMWGILVKLQIILSKLEKMTRSFLIQFHIDNSIRKILKRKK